MKKAVLSLFLFLFSYLSAISQVMIQIDFSVKDAISQQPLTNVVCRAISVNGKNHTFGITNIEGKVSIKTNETDTLVFSLIGYESVKAPVIAYKTETINDISLIENAYELREVEIKAQPIRANNDTITYLAKAFTNKGDVHLEDVLNNLPGIKVSENGFISYQGKSINKFYIEGKDLLGNNYNQATRNMPAEAIAAIEILENHQPTKMLRGKQFSDKAAINIKIDNDYKSRLFGEAEIGVGGMQVIWDNRLFLTKVGQKNQMLFTGKMNNVGTDLASEVSEHIDITDVDAYEPMPSKLLSSSGMVESIDQKRYLDNKSFSEGLNDLVSLSDSASLRLNVLAYSDNSTYKNYSKSVFGGLNKLELTQQAIIPIKEYTVQPTLKYELNGSNLFISDELKSSVNRYYSSGKRTSNRNIVEESQKSCQTYLQNYFSLSFPIKHHYMQFKSHLRYFERSEYLDVSSDTSAFDNIAERYAMRSVSSKSIISMSLPLWNNTIKLSARHYFRISDYNYEGIISSRQSKLKISPTYIVRIGNFSNLSFAVPITLINSNNISSHKTIAKRNKIGVDAEMSVSHRFSDKWNVYISASHGNDIYSPLFASPQILRTSYRTNFYADCEELYFVEHNRLSFNVSYRNLATMLFANINASCTEDKDECYVDYIHTEAMSFAKTVKGENHRRSCLLNASIDKSFPEIGLSIKTAVDYSNTTYLLSQSGIVVNNHSNITNANVVIRYYQLQWLRVDANMRGSLFWEQNKFANSDKLRQMEIKGSIYLFPSKSTEIKLSANNQINEIEKSHYKNFSLYDADFIYKLNKYLQFTFTATNLLNTKHYYITRESGVDSFYHNLPLRGREVLLKVLVRL